MPQHDQFNTAEQTECITSAKMLLLTQLEDSLLTATNTWFQSSIIGVSHDQVNQYQKLAQG